MVRKRYKTPIEFVVYLISFEDENAGHYVGYTRDIKSRWQTHTCPYTWNKYKTPIYYAMQKYGSDTASIQVLEKFDTEDEMVAGEEWWEIYLRFIGVKLYNILPCGKKSPTTLGLKFSKETKKKMSEAGKGRIVSPATKKEISESVKAAYAIDGTRSKPVYAKDATGNVIKYESAREAGQVLSLSHKSIQAAVTGRGKKKSNRFSVKDYIFTY